MGDPSSSQRVSRAQIQAMPSCVRTCTCCCSRRLLSHHRHSLTIAPYYSSAHTISARRWAHHRKIQIPSPCGRGSRDGVVWSGVKQPHTARACRMHNFPPRPRSTPTWAAHMCLKPRRCWSTSSAEMSSCAERSHAAHQPAG